VEGQRDRGAAGLGEGGQPPAALGGDRVERVEPLRGLGVAEQRDGGVACEAARVAAPLGHDRREAGVAAGLVVVFVVLRVL
jgi:hypothetical protein